MRYKQQLTPYELLMCIVFVICGFIGLGLSYIEAGICKITR